MRRLMFNRFDGRRLVEVAGTDKVRLVTRPGRYKNPHRVGECELCSEVHDRAGAVSAYAGFLLSDLGLVVDARRELSGLDLACTCPVDGEPCHAELLLRVVDAPTMHAAVSLLREAAR